MKVVISAILAIALAAFAWVWTRPQPAPEVTFKSIDGQQLKSSSLRGQYVLVNFWATSCVTCVAEMPKIIETHNKFKKRGYETVAVAMSYDRADYVLHFVKTRSLPFKVALDVDGSVAQAFGNVKITPTTFLLGPDGQILKRWVGEPDFKSLDQLLDKELKPAASA